MADAASRISLSATGQSQSVEGRVRITASDGMAAYIMPGILQRLRKRAPGIAVDLIASNSVQDLMRREANRAHNHFRQDGPSFSIGNSLPALTAWVDRIALRQPCPVRRSICPVFQRP